MSTTILRKIVRIVTTIRMTSNTPPTLFHISTVFHRQKRQAHQLFCLCTV